MTKLLEPRMGFQGVFLLRADPQQAGYLLWEHTLARICLPVRARVRLAVHSLVHMELSR